MVDCDEYEIACEKIREDNKQFIELFRNDISHLSPKTIKEHITNVSAYINDYLLYYDANTVQDGVNMVNGFLSFDYITKFVDSSPENLKRMAASIKKFYKCMASHGIVPMNEYKFMCEDIDENMEYMIADCEQYWDDSASNPSVKYM